MGKSKQLLAGGALALALTALVGAPAIAAPATGTADNPAEASIAKVLQTPDGTTLPGATFTFNVAPGTYSESTSVTPPALAAATVTYPGSAAISSAAGVKSAVLETGDLLAGITFPGAGYYTYTITEQQSVTPTPATGETYTFSQAEYELTVAVDACPLGTEAGCNGGYYVKGAGVVKTKDDTGNVIPGGPKVDPIPGGDGTTTTYSGLAFVNTYVKTGGGDPTGPADTDLISISKTVTGAGAPATDTFTFDVTATAPTLTASGTTYKAYILNGGAVVTSTHNTASGTDTYGDYLTITPGTSVSIVLGAGDQIVIPDITVGATINVNEQASSGYKPSVNVIRAGTPTTENGTLSNALPISSPITVTDAGANAADYTNDYSPVTPTGILLDILPYLLVGAIAVSGLAIIVMGTVRKQRA